MMVRVGKLESVPRMSYKCFKSMMEHPGHPESTDSMIYSLVLSRTAYTNGRRTLPVTLACG